MPKIKDIIGEEKLKELKLSFGNKKGSKVPNRVKKKLNNKKMKHKYSYFTSDEEAMISTALRTIYSGYTREEVIERLRGIGKLPPVSEDTATSDKTKAGKFLQEQGGFWGLLEKGTNVFQQLKGGKDKKTGAPDYVAPDSGVTKKGLSTGAWIGIIVGIVALIVIVVLVIKATRK